jgi:hypothetical protein
VSTHIVLKLTPAQLETIKKALDMLETDWESSDSVTSRKVMRDIKSVHKILDKSLDDNK